MKLLLSLICIVVLGGCDFTNHQAAANNHVQTNKVDELVKESQVPNKLGNYQELFVAPFMGGHAVIHAATPKGLDSSSLAFYWVQNKQQVYAVNDIATNLSPELPQHNQLPIAINPDELLETVKKRY
jgi:hypothetical protein